MRLSVHIVTHRRLALFQACLSSVLRALPASSEVVVVANGAGEETISYLRSISQETPLRWTAVPKESLSTSRNRAFSLCKGEIIHYLDDDVIVPLHLFELALQVFHSSPKLAILGGPNLTPLESSKREKLFGAVMTSPFAAPGVRSRYMREEEGPRSATENDLIFCNLALRPAQIPPSLRFRDQLRSNQENLFLFESHRLGLEAQFASDCHVFHKRRGTLRGFGKQIASYGDGRFQQSVAEPTSLRFQFAAPSICVVLALFAGFSPELWGPLGLLFLLHQLLSLGAGLLSPDIRRLGPVGMALMGPLTLWVHACYGIGFIMGFFREFYLRTPVSTPSPLAVKTD
jgi:hypothetical protein